MKSYKSFIGKIVLVFSMALMFGVLGNISVKAATVGQVLTQPELGWQRFDDTDSNISYIGINKGDSTACYNETFHVAEVSNNSTISFKFIGSQFRFIGYGAESEDGIYTVKIDGNAVGTFKCNLGKNIYQLLAFEKLNLTYGEHNVVISGENGKRFVIDAIDIDASGQLKPYSENPVANSILNVEPEKNKIKKTQSVSANLVIDNIKDIAAEDVRIKYDNTKLQFLGAEEVDGIKLVKNDAQPGELRFIVASKGEKNIANAKKALLKLNFKGIAVGEALVDVTKGRVSDGIEMEKDLQDSECGQTTITIEELKDVNNSGEFTLLDLAIDARHMGKDPKSSELTKYNTDIVENSAIDEADLLQIGKFMLENPNYKF